MQYFHVKYETQNGEHAYQESAVLSALTLKQAERRAKKAKSLFERSDLEEFCEYVGLTEISLVDYLVLKKYTLNIDHYVDEDGELRV
jgi:hypothetical protein